jgi:predicted ATPase
MPTEHAPPDIATSGAVLHGRRDELDRIERLLGDARGARGGALVISGEAGIGKSALLDAAREGASGMLVLSCRGIESEARLPFAALHQLLRPVLGHAEAIPPTQGAALRCASASSATPAPSRS